MTSHESPPAIPVFGDLLRRLRTVATLSQEELAERAGLSVRAVSNLERGVHQAPRLETVRMLADALQLEATDRAGLIAAARPDVATASAGFSERSLPLAALPLPPTRLIGREGEVAALCDLLAQGESRLVTLTGPGGTGKTRLAQEVAAAMRDHFRGGVWFVDLSPLTDATLVVPTVAAVLGVREAVGEPLRASLSRYLRDRHLVLVLDNFEQVLDAAPDVAALLASSPKLVILATSREPLRLRGEREFPLLPLPLPTADRLPAIEALARVPAVALFVERATARSPGFALMEENAAAVAAICHRLDGLPLAIELAAARINVLPPSALLARLEKRLPLLTGGGRDLPVRQRTMRDAIAWSYDLLAPEEQWVFRHLAVFAGGFTLEAAEAVAAPVETLPVLDGVIALVEQSLLRQVFSSDDEPRYLMLETVREFGLERLAAAGEEDEARQRHAEHYLRLSDYLARGTHWVATAERLTRVTNERDNVRLALTWFDERNEIDALLRLTVAAFGLWLGRGLYREGLQWLERGLARSSPEVSMTRVQALDVAGNLVGFLGDYSQAAAFSDEELALARELGDLSLIATALSNAGAVFQRRGEYERAEELYEEAHRVVQALTDPVLAALPHLFLGDTILAQGHYDRAKPLYDEVLAMFQVTGFDWGLIEAHAGLGGASYCAGNLVDATAHYAESLERAWDLSLDQFMVSSLLGLAGIAAESGSPEQGARLFGAAEGVGARLEAPIFPRDHAVRDRALAALTQA